MNSQYFLSRPKTERAPGDHNAHARLWCIRAGGLSEIAVDIERGKTLVIRLLAVSDVDEQGKRRVFFELNGEPRTVEVTDRRVAQTVKAHPKADLENPKHIAAPMPGRVVSINVDSGQTVDKGDALLSIEAMKLETVLRADGPGTVKSIPATVGMQVESHDLLVVLK